MSPITLAVVEGNAAGSEHPVTGMMLIGRDPSVDLVIPDSDVSARHASLIPFGNGFSIKDLGSTNGTFVNGSRISGPQQVRPGDRIALGGTVLEVRPTTRADSAPVAPAVQVTRVREIPALPILNFTAGQMAGMMVPVGHQIVVGRDPGIADVVLDRDSDVSRRHATFSPAVTGLTVQDLGSTNGTFVNGQRLAGAVALADGDRVDIGDAVIEVVVPGARAGARPAAVAAPAAPSGDRGRPNTIEVQGLVKEYGTHRAVNAINLFVNPGEVYGFLGPNGAGKSTTVHMLTTLLPPTSGTARIAGYDVVNEGGQVRTTIGVALQAAALDSHLNAWEHMALQTALHGIPKSRRRKIAEDLLERVALTDAAGRLVGGYSGGMKRRLDLALALVHGPRVLFLDEPTTGLDPQSRTALWEEVARLVREDGMTVFLTTQYLEEADLMADRVGIIDHGEIVAEDTPAALKAEIGRPTVEVQPVESADAPRVGEVLARFGELTSAAHGGVAARLKPGVDDLADVVRGLDAAGIRITNVQLHAPTLDDVFLIKTGRTLEGAAKDTPATEAGVLEQLNVGAGMPTAGARA